MIPVNDRSERLINLVGKATPVIWYESDSNISIKCSYCDLVEALFEVNRELAFKRYVTLERFLSYLPKDSAVIPEDMDPVLLAYGWSSQCFECWDGFFIDIYYDISTLMIDNNPVIEINFMVPYCQDCYDCDDCNMCDAALYRQMMRKGDEFETRTH